MDTDAAARLAGSAFEDETFEKLDLSGVDLAGKEFTRCAFRGVKAIDAAWGRARLEECVFDGCDLTNLRPARATLRGVDFKGCKLIGATWADLGAIPVVTFTDCAMRYQSFVSVKLPGTTFLRCALVESSFVDVELARARFRECDLAQAQFERCDLTQADFTTSRGVYFEGGRNRARGARIPVETAARMAEAAGLVVASGYYESGGAAS